MKRISIKDIANSLNISPSTVSRVLNDDSRISEKTREKVLAELKRVKYIPNQYAHNLKMQTNKNIGVFCNRAVRTEVTPYVVSEKLISLSEGCSRLGYNVSLYFGAYNFSEIWDFVLKNSLCGILSLDRLPEEVSKNIIAYNIPHVQVNWYNDVLDNSDVTYVLTDYYKSLILMLEHFAKKGYEEIEIINILYVVSFVEEMLQQAIKDFKTKNQHIKIYNVHYPIPWSADNQNMISREDFFSYLDKGLKKAYICTSSQHGAWMIQYANEHGLRVPEDLAFAIYDYNDIFNFYEPGFTGIKHPYDSIGKIAAEKVISLIEGNKEKSELVLPYFIEGETT